MCFSTWRAQTYRCPDAATERAADIRAIIPNASNVHSEAMATAAPAQAVLHFVGVEFGRGLNSRGS